MFIQAEQIPTANSIAVNITVIPECTCAIVTINCLLALCALDVARNCNFQPTLFRLNCSVNPASSKQAQRLNSLTSQG